jgi:hypothetical protein
MIGCGVIYLNHPVQDREQWRTFVNAAMNFWVA